MDIGCLDNERVAFPMSDRISKPGAHLRRHVVGCSQPNDARVMIHFSHDHDVIVRLNDGVVVVVEIIREHRFPIRSRGVCVSLLQLP
jgi:hypothetical protein